MATSADHGRRAPDAVSAGSVALSRRTFLGRVALGLGVIACRGALAQPAERAAYVGIETSAETGQSRARFFTQSGAATGTAPLDFRAHGMARNGRQLVVFPRRPGNRFALVDLETLEIRQVVDAPPERHFFGHGAFTVDGTHLLVTENDLDTLQGTIGVYDVAGAVRRLGEIALPGSGPHEIVRAPDRDLFHIALGGVETHPAYGRTPLNLGTFRSQIVSLRFDRATLDPMGFWAGTEGLSLRHLATGADGGLYIGAQLVDPARGQQDQVLWLCRDDSAVRLDAGRTLAGYVSSVAAHGETVLVTSKEAGTALTLVGDRVVETISLDGASGAALGPGLTAVSGYGMLSLNDARVPASPGHEFDNHGFAML